MPPKKFTGPRTTAVLSQTQPKQRKPRAPKQRPPGISNAEWADDVKRRATITSDRRKREEKLKARREPEAADEAEEALDLEEEAEAAKAARIMERNTVRPRLPPHVWGSQASVGSPIHFSPFPSPGWKYSPEYADGDPHGGFNPNIAFPRCPPPRGPSAFNMPYGGSPSSAPSAEEAPSTV